jgi:hypothetical protein
MPVIDRMEMASQLKEDNATSHIPEILPTSKTDFLNVRYFSRFFKVHLGYSPGKHKLKNDQYLLA